MTNHSCSFMRLVAMIVVCAPAIAIGQPGSSAELRYHSSKPTASVEICPGSPELDECAERVEKCFETNCPNRITVLDCYSSCGLEYQRRFIRCHGYFYDQELQQRCAADAIVRFGVCFAQCSLDYLPPNTLLDPACQRDARPGDLPQKCIKERDECLNRE